MGGADAWRRAPPRRATGSGGGGGGRVAVGAQASATGGGADAPRRQKRQAGRQARRQAGRQAGRQARPKKKNGRGGSAQEGEEGQSGGGVGRTNRVERGDKAERPVWRGGGDRREGGGGNGKGVLARTPPSAPAAAGRRLTGLHVCGAAATVVGARVARTSAWSLLPRPARGLRLSQGANVPEAGERSPAADSQHGIRGCTARCAAALCATVSINIYVDIHVSCSPYGWSGRGRLRRPGPMGHTTAAPGGGTTTRTPALFRPGWWRWRPGGWGGDGVVR